MVPHDTYFNCPNFIYNLADKSIARQRQEKMNHLIKDSINYICTECCGMHKDKKDTEKCESWCKKNNSCKIKKICYSLNNSGGRNEKI